ncbi:hypothetical protein AVEN_223072-1 [Araneus ventricosus]|uniref:Uncharacterized protein n=1 Tax=Araneus ventricosus TaxID=182803 RepID=A0A4Y2WS56_ARAVE|nr:hypothetical protein AVEN_223072-1 [Araneus ventricosus]
MSEVNTLRPRRLSAHAWILQASSSGVLLSRRHPPYNIFVPDQSTENDPCFITSVPPNLIDTPVSNPVFSRVMTRGGTLRNFPLPQTLRRAAPSPLSTAFMILPVLEPHCQSAHQYSRWTRALRADHAIIAAPDIQVPETQPLSSRASEHCRQYSPSGPGILASSCAPRQGTWARDLVVSYVLFAEKRIL